MLPDNQKPVSTSVVEDALKVMGAEKADRMFWLTRCRAHIYLTSEVLNAALFMHEAKLYLREKGHTGFDVRGAEKGEETFISVYGRNVCGVSLTAPTEHEAYALAVLSTVPPQVGEVKG